MENLACSQFPAPFFQSSSKFEIDTSDPEHPAGGNWILVGYMPGQLGVFWTWARSPTPKSQRDGRIHDEWAVFLFFISVFYKNIFSCSKFTWIYPGRPVAGRPGSGRPAAGRQGLICKKSRQKITPRSLKNRPPGSGAASPPGRQRGGGALAARLWGDRPPNPI